MLDRMNPSAPNILPHGNAVGSDHRSLLTNHRPAPFNSRILVRRNSPCIVGSNCQVRNNCGDHSGSKTHAVHEMPFCCMYPTMASP